SGTTFPMGKQLGLIMSLPRNGPALYVDSDVLFFPGAADLARDFTGKVTPAFFLPDCQNCSTDPRLLRGPNEALQPVNSGLLILLRPLDWSLGIHRFLALEGQPNFFTNQTIVHLFILANSALPIVAKNIVI